jgi:hypothetical protein
MPITKEDLNNGEFVCDLRVKMLFNRMKDDLIYGIIREPHKKTTSFIFTFELHENDVLQSLVQYSKHEFVNMVEETITQYYDLHDQRDLLFLRLSFNWDLLNEAFIVYSDDSDEEGQS